MATILRAQENPPFRWQHAWTPIDEAGVPKKDFDSALKQTKTFRIRWDKTTTDGKTREVSTDIDPDKGLFRAEFALIRTIPDFESKIRLCVDATLSDYMVRLYDLFGCCVQGKTSTKWSKVLEKYPVTDRTETTCKSAQQYYLEKIAEVKNLRDMVLRQL